MALFLAASQLVAVTMFRISGGRTPSSPINNVEIAKGNLCIKIVKRLSSEDWVEAVFERDDKLGVMRDVPAIEDNH